MPALRQIIARAGETGQLRRVGPDLTARQIIRPVRAHVLVAQVFVIQPSDLSGVGGLGLEGKVENQLSILEAGLRA